jgi:hypothetical protein
MTVTPLDIRLAEIARSTPGTFPPENRISFEFKVEVLHKNISKATVTPLRGFTREENVGWLIHLFLGFFSEYHVDFLKTTTHVKPNTKPLHWTWNQLLNHLHVFASNAFRYHADDMPIRETWQCGPEPEDEEIGIPIEFAQAVDAIVVWAGAHGIDVLTALQPR